MHKQFYLSEANQFAVEHLETGATLDKPEALSTGAFVAMLLDTLGIFATADQVEYLVSKIDAKYSKEEEQVFAYCVHKGDPGLYVAGIDYSDFDNAHYFRFSDKKNLAIRFSDAEEAHRFIQDHMALFALGFQVKPIEKHPNLESENRDSDKLVSYVVIRHDDHRCLYAKKDSDISYTICADREDATQFSTRKEARTWLDENIWLETLGFTVFQIRRMD